MKRAVIVAAVILGSATTVHASGTTISASPSSSVVGQRVTFTATFTFGCADGVTSHHFLIDGQAYNGGFSIAGQNATETIAISTLAAGRHSVTYRWDTSTPNSGIPPCGDEASISYVVNPDSAAPAAPRPAPPPAPKPSAAPPPSPPDTSPSLEPPSPSPTESASPFATSARLTGVDETDPTAGRLTFVLIGGALVIAVLAAAGRVYFRRR